MFESIEEGNNEEGNEEEGNNNNNVTQVAQGNNNNVQVEELGEEWGDFFGDEESRSGSVEDEDGAKGSVAINRDEDDLGDISECSEDGRKEVLMNVAD